MTRQHVTHPLDSSTYDLLTRTAFEMHTPVCRDLYMRVT